MSHPTRNQLKGRILDVKLGSIMAHVLVQVGENHIESIVTLQDAEELELQPGDPITVVIKSTDVMLRRERVAASAGRRPH